MKWHEHDLPLASSLQRLHPPVSLPNRVEVGSRWSSLRSSPTQMVLWFYNFGKLIYCQLLNIITNLGSGKQKIPSIKTTPSSALAQAQLHSFSTDSLYSPQAAQRGLGLWLVCSVPPCCSFLSDTLLCSGLGSLWAAVPVRKICSCMAPVWVPP